MKLYLHIGVEKTGTSSIQHFFDKNRQTLLNKYGILYPETGLWMDKSHHALAFAVTSDTLHSNNPENIETIFINLLNEIKSKKPDSVFISSEIFRALHQTNKFDVFNKLIQKHFSEVILIVYLRNQPYWLMSMYNQYIKDNIIKFKAPFSEFYKKMRDGIDYSDILSAWSKYIPKDNIKLFRYYEKFDAENVSSINQILEFLSIEATDLDQANSMKNISLNALQMDFYRSFNRISLEQSQRKIINKAILNNFNDDNYDYLVGEYASIDIETKIKIQNEYSQSNNLVAKNYLNSNKPLFPMVNEKIDKKDYNFLSPTNIAKLILQSSKG